VEAYRKLGIELFKPHLRRHIEAELKLIAIGHKNWQVVLKEAIEECR
jgi:DNA topoisomerase IA